MKHVFLFLAWIVGNKRNPASYGIKVTFPLDLKNEVVSILCNSLVNIQKL